jgi:hypothetical protein
VACGKNSNILILSFNNLDNSISPDINDLKSSVTFPNIETKCGVAESDPKIEENKSSSDILLNPTFINTLSEAVMSLKSLEEGYKEYPIHRNNKDKIISCNANLALLTLMGSSVCKFPFIKL